MGTNSMWGQPPRLTTDANGNTVLLDNTGARFKTEERFALPSADLVPALSASTAIPMSIGSDGMVYGSAELWSAQLARSADGFATTDLGPTLALGSYLGSPRSIIWCTKVAEGYVAIATTESYPGAPGTNTSLAAGAEIWFSTAWDSGWAKVKDIGNTALLSIAKPQYVASVGTVLLVGEYSTTNQTSHKLWMSDDGGQTWATIFDNNAINTSGGVVSAIDAAANSHIHGSCYDPFTGRIYVSCGDADNAWFGYSEDWGVTWVPQAAVAVSTNNAYTYHQPVLVHACDNGILATPDGSAGYAGTWVIDRIDGGEVPAIALETISPADQFAQAPIADDGDRVLYVMHPMTGARTSSKVFITGSGDGGRTWHKVYEAAQAANEYYERGIVGPDSNGNLYLHKKTWDGTANPATAALYVIPRITWKSSIYAKTRSIGGVGLDDLLASLGVFVRGSTLPINNNGALAEVGTLKVTGNNAVTYWGSSTASSAHTFDTPAGGASSINQKIGGNWVYTITGTSTYGQMEFNAPLTYIKFIGANGGMVATQATQKMGFWGATPVVKQTGTPAAATDLATALTLVNDLRTKLLTIGLVGS